MEQWIKLSGGGIAAPIRLALAPLILLWAAGCATTGKGPSERVPVSVSAANYSQLSDEELYYATNAPIAAPSGAPTLQQPSTPHRYLIVPGEVYPNDVPMDTVYREVESALEKRGYINAVHEKKGGRVPETVDYLLRIHYGTRLWLNPTVRGDRITWGNDGLVASRYNMGLISDFSRDPWVGLTPEEALETTRMFDSLRAGDGTIIGMKGNFAAANAHQMMNEHVTTEFFGNNDQRVARNFYLVV